MLTGLRGGLECLVGYTQSRKFRMKIEEQTKTYEETRVWRTSAFRWVHRFLEVLVNEQQYFTVGAHLAQAWSTEMQNYVQLYQALGGGWQP